jgi:signal transduction histidine kinase/ActR/RegA family two-component response regulator
LESAVFRHLRTKLTVLYAGLFAAILLLIGMLGLAALADNAERAVRKELATSSLVFQRGWAQRTAQLQTDGVLLARDFGFRTAVASRDVPTIRSSLQNLQQRLGIERAMLIAADGTVVSADPSARPLDVATLHALQGDDIVSGVLPIDGLPYETVSVPISPVANSGWVVFAAKIGRAQLQSLQSMAAIPLTASVAYQLGDGVWREEAKASHPEITKFLNQAINNAKPAAVDGPKGKALALGAPLATLAPGRPAILLLQYPLAEAMAPYVLLMSLLTAVGLLGLIVVVVGAGALARSVTRPISSLDEAAQRLMRGERAAVEVQTRDEIGRLAQSFNAMADEIHARERELETARDEAEAASRAKSVFLANMSHEVRTPLNGVIGLAGVLAGTPLGPEQKQMLGVIQNSASVLQRVLDDVLDIARVETGRLQVIEEPFDLAAAVGAIAEAARPQCQAKGLAFELTTDGVEGWVAGDRVRVEQILNNLISNAIKFTASGRVDLRVLRDGAGYSFEIRDTGIGFDPALADQLFKPFQQADGSFTRKYGGAGLGLSLSRELARAMGGDLTADAAPGAGACFTLKLPLKAVEPSQAPAPLSERPTELSERALRVLVADDHETNRLVARMVLEGSGMEVACVEDGAQALAAFEEDAFDLIFMDMQMPVMDGLTAIARIREQELATGRPRTPILVLSANAMPEHVQAAHGAGADAHIAKPITPARLLGAIEQALGSSSSGSDQIGAA